MQIKENEKYLQKNIEIGNNLIEINQRIRHFIQIHEGQVSVLQPPIRS